MAFFFVFCKTYIVYLSDPLNKLTKGENILVSLTGFTLRYTPGPIIIINTDNFTQRHLKDITSKYFDTRYVKFNDPEKLTQLKNNEVITIRRGIRSVYIRKVTDDELTLLETIDHDKLAFDYMNYTIRELKDDEYRQGIELVKTTGPYEDYQLYGRERLFAKKIYDDLVNGKLNTWEDVAEQISVKIKNYKSPNNKKNMIDEVTLVYNYYKKFEHYLKEGQSND